MHSASGILFVDKPLGPTSHGVVARVRRLAGTRKVGHAGTLDPLASGLLVLGVNSATRLLTHLVGLDKEYLATIRLGEETTTDDAEGDAVATADSAALARVDDAAIRAGVAALTGELQQVPSSVSAVKVEGRRAYDLARSGEEVRLKARGVTVSAFDVLEIRRTDRIEVDVRIACSSGTYVRALARDLGRALAVGGHLTALRRTRVGPFSVAEAATLEELDPVRHLVAPARIAEALFPVARVDEARARDLAHGKRIRLPGADASPVAVIDEQDRLVSLVERVDGVARVLTNFPTVDA